MREGRFGFFVRCRNVRRCGNGFVCLLGVVEEGWFSDGVDWEFVRLWVLLMVLC